MMPEQTLNANFTPDCKMKSRYSRKPNAKVRNVTPLFGTGRVRTKITGIFIYIYKHMREVVYLLGSLPHHAEGRSNVPISDLCDGTRITHWLKVTDEILERKIIQ